MIKIDLITGFLGAGKTTFIRKYAEYLMKCGCNIGILENDFGAVNIDMMMLQDLMGDQCEIEMISGGCDKETHKRRFKTKLIAMGMCGFDRILVEPSGIFDVDEFFDVLQEEPLNRWYETGSVTAIVDAEIPVNLNEQETYIFASEIANAGKIVLSKIPEKISEMQREEVLHSAVKGLNEALQKITCRRVLRKEDIFCKELETWTNQDFEELKNSSYFPEYSYEKRDFLEEETFETFYFFNKEMKEASMRKAAEELFSNKKYGHIFRIKGFLKTDNPMIWEEFNAVPKNVRVKRVKEGQEVLIVIGSGLNRQAIDACLN